MEFNSVPYLVILMAAVSVFWVLPIRFRRPFVFAASVAFYGTWGLIFLWVPLLVAGIVYVIGRQITRDGGQAREWLWLGIVCVLTLLIAFKYRGFLFTNLISAGGMWTGRWGCLTAIAFPVGISFFTFEAIAYLVDLRQRRVRLPGFLDLCLFFFFWPNVVSGPLVRARELVPQLGFGKPFESRFVFEGVDRVVWGLVQKNVLANTLGIWVDRGFSTNTTGIPTTLDGWSLAIAFALQIYFDFSAYSNIAIGAAQLLGVTLPENFRQPYHAGTPAEFWSRWHMTLSRWVRDYLFFPINAKWKGAPLPLYISLIGVMGLVGLWHGAGWGFVIWGLLHGIYLALYRIYEGAKTTRVMPEESRFTLGIVRILTLVGIIAAWVPFRSPTLQKAGAILSSMFYRFRSGATLGTEFYVFGFAVILFCVIEPGLIEKLNEIEERSGATGPSVFRIVGRPILYLLGITLFLLFDGHNAQFIYSQF